MDWWDSQFGTCSESKYHELQIKDRDSGSDKKCNAMPRAKEYDSDSLRLSSAVNVGLSAFLWHKLGMAQVVFDSLNLTVHWNRTLLGC